MQIDETTNDGLKREYALTIPAADLSARIDGEVSRIAPQVRMPGFRPGKVPANLVRKMHGDALHAEALQTAVREGLDTLIRDKSLRPALQPKVDLDEQYEQGKDVKVTVAMELLPDIEAPSTEGLKLTRMTVPVDDAAVDKALEDLAAQQKSYKDAAKTKKAADGDQLIIDFVGRVDGTEFEGGKAEGQPLEIGSGRFIPGFEEQLTGVKTGDEKTIKVTFPEDYPAANLAGKEAEFDVTVQQVKIATETTVDDDFAKNMGLPGLDKLKELLRGQLEQELAGLTRTQMKRQLLDKLAEGHDFEVPPTMVEAEFEQIWRQLQQEASREADPKAAMAEIESERAEYQAIAERRVRLGLLLSEIGGANGVEVSQQEMQQLLQQEIQRVPPEQREQFMEMVRNEPMAQAQLRAPLYEEKVVDFLFDKAEVTEIEATREQLEAAIEEGEEAEEAKLAKKAAAKKPAAKKAPAKKADDADGEKPAAKKASAKKPAAKKAPAKNADDGDKAAPAKKPVAKKAPAKKAPAKKAPAKKGE